MPRSAKTTRYATSSPWATARLISTCADPTDLGPATRTVLDRLALPDNGRFPMRR